MREAMEVREGGGMKPKIFAVKSKEHGWWLWRCSWDDNPPCNFFHWDTAISKLRMDLANGILPENKFTKTIAK